MSVALGKLLLFAIALPLIVGCAQNSFSLQKANRTQTNLICSFAEKGQILETSVRIGEEHLEGNLAVFDTRHKVFVEKITGGLVYEEGFWILRSLDKSDSVVTSREHKINQTTLAYERKSLVKMGSTPPLTIFNVGKCERI